MSNGDRVIRARDIFDDRALQVLRHGVIVEEYSGAKNLRMFAVRWDDTGTVERGYLEVGLALEPLRFGIWH